MKKIITIIILSIFIISCKAQVIGTLEQLEECRKRPNHDELGCPDLENITYVKDTNNRLDQFVGTWKGSYNGKSYEFRFVKKIKYGNYAVKWDQINGNIIIKNNDGQIIYDDTDPFVSIEPNLWGINFQGRVYELGFSNIITNTYCNDSGSVYIEISKTDQNKMSLFFYRNSGGLYDPTKCPNYETYVPVLPTAKIILNKQ